MFRKMDIKVKIALVYSVIVIIMGVGVAVFLSLAIKQSMKSQPVTQSIGFVTYAVSEKDNAAAHGMVTAKGSAQVKEDIEKRDINSFKEKRNGDDTTTYIIAKKEDTFKISVKEGAAYSITEEGAPKTGALSMSEESAAKNIAEKEETNVQANGVAKVSQPKETNVQTNGVAKVSQPEETNVHADEVAKINQPEESIIITDARLNQNLSSEIFKRLIRYSAIAIFIMLVSIFFIGYNVSKWLLKPLTTMASVTNQISADNLDLRLSIPESNDELRKLSYSFNTTMDGLQKAFLELERFNSYASHELKNALAVMKTRLEVDYNENDCRETVAFAITQVNRITKSINDILAISSTGIKDSGELVDIAMAAAKVVDEYQATGRKIMLNIPDDGVLPVRGKEIWFQRVIANLVDNAIKHSDNDSLINIKVKQDFEAVIITVSDSGRGIACSQQERIWAPYFTTSSEWEKGYGLGLAMVRHIVDICNGLVWVDSAEGKGSTFYISLPIARA